MAHDHNGGAHNHAAGANSKMLAIALALTTAFLIAELVGSYLFSSTASPCFPMLLTCSRTVRLWPLHSRQ